MALEINEADPCGAAAQLRAIYYNLIAGQATAEISFRAGPNGVERRVSYAKADLAKLEREIERFGDLCAASLGNRPRPRRFAISTGGRF